MDLKKVGNQIAALRKSKNMTQSDLGERLGVSFQAVSKWERGETMPDVTLLPELSNVLGCSIDYILKCGEQAIGFRGKIQVENVINGLKCIKGMGELLGEDNLIYQSAIQGINQSLNTQIQRIFTDDYAFEAFVAECVIQSLNNGAYVDITDVKNSFKHDHFKQIVLNCCKLHKIV